MFLWISLVVFVFGGSGQWWSVKNSGVDTNLRGVSVVLETFFSPESVVWASGSHGVVLRSADSGKSWKRLQIPDAESLDFRGVQAFGENIAYVMASGEGNNSSIYKTSDGGKTWTKQYSDARKAFFLDAIACSDEAHCFALSDPVDGKFLLVSTSDGQHWQEVGRENMPSALPSEGAFAASNSSMILEGKDIYFGTGGPAARVFHSPDLGRTWSVAETPIFSGKPSAGIFSLAADGDIILAVGGDYQDPKLTQKLAATSHDAGKTWRLTDKMPGGYRSAISKCGSGFVSVGPTGADINYSYDRWSPISQDNFNALAYSKGQVWAVGPNGTIARFVDQTKVTM
jgi:photosystem II stability/assembly factor-like uncharacterized protein